MNRRNRVFFAVTALAGASALLAPSTAPAQEATSAGIPSLPRTRNDRVVTELPVPPTANSDALKAAEGRLGPVPAVGVPAVGVPAVRVPATGPGAIDPAAATVAPVPGQIIAIDPAVRLQPAVISPLPAGRSIAPGMEVAMLVEHAVAMAIEGSALGSIASAAGGEPGQRLSDQSQRLIQESKALLTRAAADGREVPAGSPARRFYSAANAYVGTLAALSAPGPRLTPADMAQVAMINHSVKSVLDADHIQHMGRGYAGTIAMDQLMIHARDMRNAGTQMVRDLAGSAPLDPNAVPSANLLALRGRELLDAATELNNMVGSPAVMAPPVPGRSPGLVPAVGDNVGRLRDTRPEIIGGTFGTGSPTAGTATGAEAAANVRSSRELPNGELVSPTPTGKPGTGISNYGVGNNNTPPTNSTGGLNPR